MEEKQQEDTSTFTKQLLLITGVLAFSACSLAIPTWLFIAILFVCLLFSTTKTLHRIYGKKIGPAQTHRPLTRTKREILAPAVLAVLSIPVAIFLLILALITIFAIKAILNLFGYCTIPLLILWIITCCFANIATKAENIPPTEKGNSQTAQE